MTPLISIIVPAFNDAASLEDALSSILAQSLSDLEVVISDDASTDQTPEIAEKWSQRDSRFFLVRNESNLGMTENWNRALRVTKGRFVCKLDADDAMEPHCLESLVQPLLERADLSASFCRTAACDSELERLGPYRGDLAFSRNDLDPGQARIAAGSQWYELCFDDIQLWHSNAQMFRREYLLALGGWDETLSCASDTDLILRVLENPASVSHSPYLGILYRQREDSVSARFRRERWLQLEGYLVALRSLDRVAKRRALSLRLRHSWWRIWRNYKELSRSPEIFSSMSPRVRAKLSSAMNCLEGPPLSIRARGWLHDRASQFKHRILHEAVADE